MPATARKPMPTPTLELTVERDALDSALKRLAETAKGQTAIPVTSHIRVYSDGLTAAVRACNGEQDLQIAVPADMGGAGDLCLPGAPFRTIVGGFRSGASVTLRADAAGQRCAISSGRSRYTLHALPGPDLPDIAPDSEGERFTLPGAALADTLARLGFAVATESTRWFLCGIFWTAVETDNGLKLALVAGNGAVLAKRLLPAPEGLVALGSPERSGVIVPAAALPALRRMGEAHEAVSFAVTPSKLTAEAGDTRLTTKLLDSPYPDFRRYTPAPSGRAITVDRADMLGALARLAAVEADGYRGAKLAPADNGLAITNLNPELGDAAEEIAAETEQDCAFGLLRANLAAALESFKGETIQLDQAQTGMPVLATGTGEADAGFDAVLMPYRV